MPLLIYPFVAYFGDFDDVVSSISVGDNFAFSDVDTIYMCLFTRCLLSTFHLCQCFIVLVKYMWSLLHCMYLLSLLSGFSVYVLFCCVGSDLPVSALFIYYLGADAYFSLLLIIIFFLLSPMLLLSLL